MTHMKLEEWDKIAPIFAAMRIRSTWVRTDAAQLRDWVRGLPVVPAFDTEAFAGLCDARDALEEAHQAVAEAIQLYLKKDKVT